MSLEPAPPGSARGLLVAVVGPSGAGKDTLIRLAMARFGDGAGLSVARRVITRTPDGASEDHDTLDPEGFARAEAAGAFCLSWRAHGLSYGLPRGVLERVGAGELVLANLSRTALGDAARRFGRLSLVEITAPPETLVARIAARGRERPADIARRLAREAGFEPPPGTVAVLRIDNSGPPELGAGLLHRHLVALLDRTAGNAADDAVPGRTRRSS